MRLEEVVIGDQARIIESVLEVARSVTVSSGG